MAAQVEIEDQASVTNLDNGEIFDPLSDDADSIILLGEGNPERDVITTCLLSGMGTIASETTIVAVRKNSPRGITTRAKFVAFKVFTEALARKKGGDANVKYGWYAASKDEIETIITFGFSNRHLATSHGTGIQLLPSNCSIFASLGTEADEEGLRHLLLCRILLGKPEPIVSGSKQSHPSSTDFDSGVDNVHNPTKYIIWSSTMNSYILPSYIVSFRNTPMRVLTGRPSSPWVSFAALMSLLSNFMDQSRMNSIMTSYTDYRRGKIRRYQLVQKMRQVAGDNLLAEIIKNHRDRNKVKV